MPLEYCEFNSNSVFSKCKEWLQEYNATLFQTFYPEAKIENESCNSEKPQSTANKKKKAPVHKVTVTIVERTKRKRVTHITGLELFGVELKSAAKLFANKFATGSAVNQTGAGSDEIIIQGDVAYEISDFLVSQFPDVMMENIQINTK